MGCQIECCHLHGCRYVLRNDGNFNKFFNGVLRFFSSSSETSDRAYCRNGANSSCNLRTRSPLDVFPLTRIFTHEHCATFSTLSSSYQLSEFFAPHSDRRCDPDGLFAGGFTALWFGVGSCRHWRDDRFSEHLR